MTRPNKRQAQIRRLAEAKRKRTRLNRDDADPLPHTEDTTDLSSELSGFDETSSESSSEGSSDESIAIEPEAITSRQISDVLKWHDGAGKGKGSGLRSSYSGSSKSTRKRRRRHQRELERASANTANILELFAKQQQKQQEKDGQDTTPTSLGESHNDSEKSERRLVTEELEKLLKSTKEQVKRYGRVLPPTSDFYRQHLMVRSFFYLQQQKDTLQLNRRRDIAVMAAANFKRGKVGTGKKIVRWEREWLKHRRIPESKAGKHSAGMSWLEDEGVLCAVRVSR